MNFNCDIACFNYIFIIITETWFNNNFYSSELRLNNYNIYRCDWSSLSSSCNLGGGILIGVRKEIPSFIVNIHVHNVEQLFICLEFKSLIFIINSVYLPSACSSSVYDSYVFSIDSVFLHHSYHFLYVVVILTYQKSFGQMIILAYFTPLLRLSVFLVFLKYLHCMDSFRLIIFLTIMVHCLI